MKICVVRHASYPEDPRVRKEVSALLSAGHEVDLLCTQALDKQHPRQESDGKLTIYRMPFSHRRGSVARYVGLYLFSLLAFTWVVTQRHLQRRYDLVQVNTMPDGLVFCTAFLRLFRVPVLLDVHEPTPELWTTKYGDGLPFLRWVQGFVQIRAVNYANHVVTVTAALRQRLLEKTSPRTGITVVPNAAPLSFAAGVKAAAPSGKHEFRLATHGAIEERYGHELVIRAVHELRTTIPGLSYDIIGEGAHEPGLRQLVDELDCSNHVRFLGFLSFDELRSRLSGAALGIVPMRRSPYSELIDTNKMYEFMLLGVPVLHSRLPVVEACFDSNTILFFEPDDVASLAREILAAWQNPESVWRIAGQGQERARALAWENIQGTYLEAVQGAALPGGEVELTRGS